jgi:hypothetical protein
VRWVGGGVVFLKEFEFTTLGLGESVGIIDKFHGQLHYFFVVNLWENGLHEDSLYEEYTKVSPPEVNFNISFP